jgi:hypothetical protein
MQTLLWMPKNRTGRFCTAEEMQSGGVGGRKRTDADGRDKNKRSKSLKTCLFCP